MLSIICRSAAILFLTIAQAQACAVADKRVCDIDTKLQAFSKGHAVVYKHESMLGPAEYEWVLNGQDFIYVDDTKDLGDDELFFVIAHEFGHSVKKSGRRVLEHFAGADGAKLSDEELLKRYGDRFQRPDAIPRTVNHDQEFLADEFACQAMSALGMNCVKAMYDALRSAPGSHRHPTKADRVSRARAVVRQSAPVQVSMN